VKIQAIVEYSYCMIKVVGTNRTCNLF